MPSVAALFRLLLSFAAPCFTVNAQAQIILSDFNSVATTTDGWQKYSGGDGGSSVSWTAIGGNGGTGGLVLNDAATGQNDYFDAPAKFLGNQSVFYGGTLSFDLLITSPVDLPEADNVVLTGNGVSISYNLLSYPVTTGFTSYSINLLENSGWFITGTSTAPSQSQMLSVLSNLTDLRILADWHNGPENDVLDNVQLAAVPEPTRAALLLGCGALAFVRFARRRQTHS